MKPQSNPQKDLASVLEEELFYLKMTCERLIRDKPDRDWVIEEDFEKWASVLRLREALSAWHEAPNNQKGS